MSALLSRLSMRARVGLLVGTGVLVVVGTSLGRETQAERDARNASFAAAVTAMAEGRDPDPATLSLRPPRDTEGRVRWVSMQSVADTRRELEALYARYGVMGFEPPEGWLEESYVLGAGAHADVGRHWKGWLAFYADQRDSIPAIVERTLRVRAEEAGATSDELRGMLAGVERARAARRELMDAMQRYAVAAAELHDYLATYRYRPRVEDGQYVFSASSQLSDFRSKMNPVTTTQSALSSVFSRMSASRDPGRELSELVAATGGPRLEGGQVYEPVDAFAIRSSVRIEMDRPNNPIYRVPRGSVRAPARRRPGGE